MTEPMIKLPRVQIRELQQTIAQDKATIAQAETAIAQAEATIAQMVDEANKHISLFQSFNIFRTYVSLAL